MKLIIGLGNPGKEYINNRHNAGFLFLDFLQQQYKLPEFSYSKKFNADTTEGFIGDTKYLLAKPQTFMNCSGHSVRAIIDFFKMTPQDIIVVADDLDIEIGTYKISHNSSSAGHNGVQHIIDLLGTQNFTRLRIGVEKTGGRESRGEITGNKFVLQNFSKNEHRLLQNTFEHFIKSDFKNLQNKKSIT